MNRKTLCLGAGIAVIVFGLTGCCPSGRQGREVLTWSDTSRLIDDLRGEFDVRVVSPDSVLRRIGPPDRRVPPELLGNVLPGRWGAIVTDDAVKMHRYHLQHLGMEASHAEEEVRNSTFWLYDESARYWRASQPASFFGMGTGFQLIWFAVDKNQHNVLASGGFGLGKGASLKSGPNGASREGD